MSIPVRIGLVGTALGVLLGSTVGCASSVTVRVLNDSGQPVRIASCVDDSADIGAGQEFNAQGVPSHGALACLVTAGDQPSRCVALKLRIRRSAIVPLSRFSTVPESRCS